MIQRSPAVDDLVRRILRLEAGGVPGPEPLADAVAAACLKLAAELEPLVGRGGVEALLGRAVNLARRDVPLLESVRSQPGATLAGLREALRGCGPAEAEAVGVALLASLLGLLVNLLGEELGLRPAWKVWPGASPGAAPPTPREMEE